MIPVIIEDLIVKATDKNTHPEKRQHYVTTLIRIQKSIEVAIADYENERKTPNHRKKIKV